VRAPDGGELRPAIGAFEVRVIGKIDRPAL
jgi:hypothetical protein